MPCCSNRASNAPIRPPEVRQKNDKNQPKNPNNDDWIIKKNNLHWKTKSKLNKLSKSKQKTLHNKALQWLHKQWAKDKQGGAGNNSTPTMTYQLILADSPADPDGIPHVAVAHNLMTSSSGTSSNAG